MIVLLRVALILPLIVFGWAGAASAESLTRDSVSSDLAAGRSMDQVPEGATNVNTQCVSFGPTPHYRCTTTWDE
jgi:hypothetical protein